MTDFWTADRIETLRTMKAAGAKVREMTAALGDACTRNMVVGKLARMGLLDKGKERAWTPERKERLKALHATGARFADIADEIGNTTAKGVEKMAAKMGLPRRAYHHRPGAGIVRARPKPRLVVPLVEPSTDLAATILAVTGCRWAITPHDAPKDAHMFCNHPTELNEITGKSRPYCPYHSEMNRAKPVPKAEVKRFVIPTSVLRAVA